MDLRGRARSKIITRGPKPDRSALMCTASTDLSTGCPRDSSGGACAHHLPSAPAVLERSRSKPPKDRLKTGGRALLKIDPTHGVCGPRGQGAVTVNAVRMPTL